MMEVIEAIYIPAVGGVTEHINPTLVVGFKDCLEDFIILDPMVIALNPHGAAEDIVQTIVAHPISHAFKQNGGGVGVVDPRQRVNVTVLHIMLPRYQRFPDTTGNNYSASVQRINIAREKPMRLAAADLDPVARAIPDCAPCEHTVRPGAD